MVEDLSNLSVSEFTEDPIIFSAFYEAVTVNIFYNSQEYVRTLSDTYDLIFDSSKSPVDHIAEPALEEIILPIHQLLASIFRMYRKSIDESQRKLIRSKFLPSFFGLLVPLLETPIDEERESFGAIFNYVAQNLDLDYQEALIISFDSFVSKVIDQERPVRGIEHILAVSSHLVVASAKNPELQVLFTDFAENTLAPLYSHPHFILFHEEYSQFLVYYLRFFHLKDGMQVKRTPFDPMFPVEAPFADDNEFVQNCRKEFLDYFPNSDLDHPNSNQQAFAYLILYLAQHEFYPRSKVPDLVRSLLMKVPYSADDAVLNALIAILRDEVFSKSDSTRREVLHLLWSTKSNFEKPVELSSLQNISPEM